MKCCSNSNEGRDEEEEETLIRMVHNFIESEPPKPQPSSHSLSHEFTLHMLEGILKSSTDAEKEVEDKAMKYVKEIGEENIHTNSDSTKERVVMRLRMDGFDASICQSSWAATSDYPGGAYEYIVIEQKSEESRGGSNRLIIDMDFRSQFAVARPTARYTKLASMLPLVFVGSDEKVKKIVSILCRAAQQSLKQNGLHVPPWRKLKYMQSKWLLRRSYQQVPCAEALAFACGPGNNMAWFKSKSRVWPL